MRCSTANLGKGDPLRVSRCIPLGYWRSFDPLPLVEIALAPLHPVAGASPFKGACLLPRNPQARGDFALPLTPSIRRPPPEPAPTLRGLGARQFSKLDYGLAHGRPARSTFGGRLFVRCDRRQPCANHNQRMDHPQHDTRVDALGAQHAMSKVIAQVESARIGVKGAHVEN